MPTPRVSTHRIAAALVAAGIILAAGAVARAQQAPFDRLPASVLDVRPPSTRVAGTPGQMRVSDTGCRTLPDADVRRRVVDLAVQEWAFFGFSILDQTVPAAPGPNRGRRGPRPSGAEALRIADSIGGYWTVTPEGGWILENQNQAWNRAGGGTERWRYPWSAAFISWLMCEGGLGDSSRFRRAIAHHSYIDQAIRARDQGARAPAYAAYEAGEADIAPGDLLCNARRPQYQTLAERRRQMGEGANTHCDVVVKVDGPRGRILAIGGNVLGTVSLKVLPASSQGGRLRPATMPGQRAIFAHLKLRTDAIENDALDHTPTVRALGCGAAVPAQVAAANLVAAGTLRCAD